jgi:predicted DNA-binding ribbon-helix-helix protein
MKSTVIKRSIVVVGRKTSVSLEDPFWNGLKEIAKGRGVTMGDLVACIESDRHHSNLSSAIRLFVLGIYRDAVTGKSSGPQKTASSGSETQLSPKPPITDSHEKTTF